MWRRQKDGCLEFSRSQTAPSIVHGLPRSPGWQLSSVGYRQPGPRPSGRGPRRTSPVPRWPSNHSTPIRRRVPGRPPQDRERLPWPSGCSRRLGTLLAHPQRAVHVPTPQASLHVADWASLLPRLQGLCRSASTTGISPDAGNRATENPGVSSDRSHPGWSTRACHPVTASRNLIPLRRPSCWTHNRTAVSSGWLRLHRPRHGSICSQRDPCQETRLAIVRRHLFLVQFHTETRCFGGKQVTSIPVQSRRQI